MTGSDGVTFGGWTAEKIAKVEQSRGKIPRDVMSAIRVGYSDQEQAEWLY